MSYQTTTNLQLKKDNSDEQIVNWRTHNNDNLDTLDQLIHYILLSMAPIENGTTSSTAYNAGSYMIFNGRLCRATNRIGAGDSLLIGVNIEYAKIGNIFVILQNALSDINAWQTSNGVFDVDLIPNLSASKITTDTFSADRIPSLPASKIKSGTFSTSRIPSLPASKITSGTFNADRIPSLPASKITSGTLPVAYGGSGQSAPTVDSVKNNIVKSTGTNCSVTGYSVVKWGKIVQLYLAITVSTAKNTGDVLATVQTDYVPLMTTPLMNLANLAKGCSVQESSGEIKARAAFTANETMYVVGTYLIA